MTSHATLPSKTEKRGIAFLRFPALPLPRALVVAACWFALMQTLPGIRSRGLRATSSGIGFGTARVDGELRISDMSLSAGWRIHGAGHHEEQRAL